MRPRRDSTAAIARRVWDIDVAGPAVEKQRPRRYPPISSIPRTSAERLAQAGAAATTPTTATTTTTARDQGEEEEEEEEEQPVPVPASSEAAISGSEGGTVLYLAYGSNLAAETFLGTRKIRPLSQVNVSAPSLRLTFDLPGLPYREPCFANTAPRRLPRKPPVDLPAPPSPPAPPVQPPPPHHAASPDIQREGGGGGAGDWDKGLIGVVYEVTTSDYARIVATEGGGSSYQDILVPCFVLPPTVGVPEKPPLPELPPRPFLAHTLYAPRLPDIPDPDAAPDTDSDDGDGDGDGDDEDAKLPRWLRRLLLPVRRPEPDYAQPSPRYLDLLRTGAREHDLPPEYQAYLASLQPYTPTSFRQRLGGLLFALAWLPMFGIVFGLSRWLADDRGRVPRWLGALLTLSFNLGWLLYDAGFKPVFGDGERTVDGGDKNEGRIRLGDGDGDDDEKDGGVAESNKRSQMWRPRTRRSRRRSSGAGSLGYSDEAVLTESEGED